MKHILIAIFALSLLACGDTNEPTDIEGESNDRQSSAEALANAEASADSKGDETIPCGDDNCAPSLCGYDCSTSGQQCTRTCADADTRPATSVKFEVSGSETASMDSTELGYVPEFRLNDVLFFGCEVWDYSNQSKDGFEVRFEEVISGSAVPGRDQDIGNKAVVYMAPFEGPGSYMGEGYFKASSDAEKSYFTKEGCGFEVSADSDGMLNGTVLCSNIPARKDAGGSITLRGEFSCGVNATDQMFIDLTP